MKTAVPRSAAAPERGEPAAAPGVRDVRTTLALLAVGLLVMYAPTLYDVWRVAWHSDDQGHGPVILGVALWLIWRRRDALLALSDAGAPRAGTAVLVLALASYVLGRSQGVLQLEVGSLIVTLMALLLLWGGAAALRLSGFALFFMIFMIPMPGVFVQMVTVPLKSAVSHVAENLLFACGYPISRAGVVLNIGPYQLLVADACSGLNSMFTLESLGLLYMNLMRYASLARNVLLAALIIPISFTANVIRVIILVLVTYYFGDEAGQGFVHEFAGLVLFIVALFLMIGVDTLIGSLVSRRRAAP
jgi:exosortase B